MPVLPLSQKKSKDAPFVGETEFVAPDNEAEQVKIYIFMAQAEFNDEALQADYGSLNTDQTDFISVLKTQVLQYDSAALRRRTEENGGSLTLRLDGNNVELVRGRHFFYNVKDRNSFNGN